jgi:nitroreductase
MELKEAIEKRRTIRIFKKKASEEQLRKIILAGTRRLSRKFPAPGSSLL